MSSSSTCPILHNLKKYFPQKYLTLAHDVWEIPVPVNDIVWTIFLSYCCSASDAILSKRLATCGAKSLEKGIKNGIKHYNPFLHRNTCFRDEKLTEAVEIFRKRIETFDNSLKQVWNFRKVIQAASELLSCNVILMSDDWMKKMSAIEVFCNSNSQQYENVIFIFSKVINHEKSNEYETYFSFGMLKKYGLLMQKSALEFILADLEYVDRSAVIRTIFDSPNDNNFPLIALKNYCEHDCISKVYKSPYTIAKLQEAGLSTDPLIVDEDSKSSLFYSLFMKDENTLYILHEHAANASTILHGSIRTPNLQIIRNLDQLEKHLKYLFTKINSHSVTATLKYRKRLEDLCYLNKFLTAICESVLKENSKFEESLRSITGDPVMNRSDDGKLRIKIKDAEHKKNIILSILNCFCNFFDGGKTKDFKFEGLIEYLRYEDYFTKSDFFATLFFFDNIYLLKKKMKLPDQKYSQIEANLFSFFFVKTYFEQFELNECESILRKFTVFHMRVCLQKELKHFEECLTDEQVTENNIVEWLPHNEVAPLKNSPEIHGAFIDYKIIHYLDAAISVKVRDIKSVLVIERCLYILGEYLGDNDVTSRSIRKVLQFVFPRKFLHCITKFRNKITHSDKMSSYRILAENNIQLFCEIQKEIKNLKLILQFVFCTQRFFLEQYFLKIFLSGICELKVLLPRENDIPHIIDLLSLPVDKKSTNLVSEFKISWENYLGTYYDSLNKRFPKHVCNVQGNSDSRDIAYKFIFLNIFNNANEEISEFEFGKNKRKFRNLNSGNQMAEADRRIKVAKVEDYFWCYEYLLEHILNKSSKHLQTTFLKLSDQRKSFFESLSSNQYPESLTEEVREILSKYKRFVDQLFVIDPHISVNMALPFYHIKCLSGVVFLNSNEQNIILRSVSTDSKNIHRSKLWMVKYLTCGTSSLQNEQFFRTNLKKIDLEKKYRNFILNNYVSDPMTCRTIVIDNAKDYYEMLKKEMDKAEINKTVYELLCKKLELPTNSISLLGKLVKRENQSSSENKLQFLQSRIKYLKDILVYGNEDIKLLWKIGKSENTLLYIKEKIIQTYIRDPDVQIALDMLLFDCMNIMKPDKDNIGDLESEVFKHLTKLWLKRGNLLQGICLRNVLAHGDPLLESLGVILDNEDLPHELVTKMLQLVKEGDTIDCILKVMSEINTITRKIKSITGEIPKNLAAVISNTNDIFPEYLKKTIDEIKACPRWEDYANLISI